ncbi:olfactory receptor 7C1-like [Suncus etruscus]|uniref:olfactory receptor 7C1-like n=1 Tax=Suncus etruscus TaxID=109475 RepID=UPI00210F4912|nr:olfactory receptor 7C1-like [Suncus etruscus]
MEPQNQSRALGFLLSGFSGSREVQFLLFGLFLTLYLATVLGNLLIILSIGTDRHLHTPMYFFLAHLSWADIGFVSTTVLKMLNNIRTQNPAISYRGCLSQIFFFIVFGCLDNLLLTVMAYDRCVAICHPLHYTAIMHPQLCGLLVLGCWGLSVLASLLETLPVLRLAFCTHRDIHHFFCDLPQVLKLACSDSLLNHVVVYATTALLGVVPFNAILVSYYRIVSAILRISSAGARSKAFSTCASHLLVVSLFYGTGLGVYLSSAATVSSTLSLVASVMYTMVTPMLNPFIYSLRNKEMRGALGRLWHLLLPPQTGTKLS